MKNKKRRSLTSIATWMTLLTLLIAAVTGCGDTGISVSVENSEDDIGDKEEISLIASFYDNRGNNLINFTGKTFNIQPNRMKQWGYNTEGSYVSYYDTSSVITITVDGEQIPTCGSTVLFYDDRINFRPVPPDMLGTYGQADGTGYEVTAANEGDFEDWFALTTWWYDQKEKGQHGSKLVLIQSQDGYDIGIVTGDDVTWDIAEKLPKTTLIMVDDMPLYIHRCNFIIIPTKLLELKTEERKVNP